jgi:O-antigen/teichoic acid export membrane protein
MSKSIFKTILSHAPKYLTGSVIAAGTTLLMTKYYTTVFSPAQFGTLALYLVMFDYIRTFVSLNMDSGATRFYFDYRDTRRDEYLSTIFWFITFIAFVVMIVGMIFKDFISNWIAPNTQDVYLATIFLGIGAVYVSFLTRILYNEHKSTSVLKHTIFQTFVNHLVHLLLSHFSILVF